MWISNYYNLLIFFLWLILQSKKPKKQDSMSLEEAMDDSENLTDFLMDFEEDNWYLHIPGYVYIVRLGSTNFLSFDNKFLESTWKEWFVILLMQNKLSRSKLLLLLVENAVFEVVLKILLLSLFYS